ncbi:MAG: hypothetical protein WBA23_18820 [Tunicatimonas sp.]|uniref:hypothetical protein n=1 Tax=Tunicatimonas sp. TaxID=1940096 RepID=UPI003C7575CA
MKFQYIILASVILGNCFPIIPLSDGDFGMATPIQNKRDNQFGFTWWRLAVE